MMRRTIIAFLFVLSALSVQAADIYIRDDGGTTAECDGTVDAPKNDTKKCALNTFYKEMKFSSTTTDNIILRRGVFLVSVQPPSLWITVAQFNAKPEYYIREAKKGRKVYFQRIDGIAYELILRKY